MLKTSYSIDLLVADISYTLQHKGRTLYAINVLLRVNDENNIYRFVFNGCKTTDFWHKQYSLVMFLRLLHNFKSLVQFATNSLLLILSDCNPIMK